jgi:hypothetical protein
MPRPKDIEEAFQRGTSYAVIARVLKKIEAYPDWMSVRP